MSNTQNFAPGEDANGQTLGPVCYATIPPSGGSQSGFMTLDEDGNPVLYSLGGAIVPAGTYIIVICPLITQQSHVLCDAGNADHQFLRWYVDSPIVGISDAQWDFELDGSTPYVPVGPVVVCGTDVVTRDVEQVVLCDNNGPFIRAYQYGDDTGTPSGVPTDYTLAGGPYVPVGPVVNCATATPIRDSESFILCSSTPAPGTQFIRTRVYNELGVITATVDTTLAGAPFVPGTVSVCTTAVASDFDFLSTVLCSTTAGVTTPFIQRLTFNSATGAVTATTNTTLTGGAFVPGTVDVCSNCCPSVIGEGCTNVGSGHYTAIRATNGTITLIDSVTGAAVLAANIVPCPSDNVVKTLTAQARTLTNATPWTPGADVVGTLTSLTVTGISGLWDMVDQNGTVLTGLPAGLTLTWGAEDDNTLSGPTSVTPQAGSSVVANWTQR